MKLPNGQPTICSVLNGIKGKVKNHMNNRGVGIVDKTIKEIDVAIGMAERMNVKLLRYKKKENDK